MEFIQSLTFSILEFYQEEDSLCLFIYDPENDKSQPFECISFFVDTCSSDNNVVGFLFIFFLLFVLFCKLKIIFLLQDYGC